MSKNTLIILIIGLLVVFIFTGIFFINNNIINYNDNYITVTKTAQITQTESTPVPTITDHKETIVLFFNAINNKLYEQAQAFLSPGMNPDKLTNLQNQFTSWNEVRIIQVRPYKTQEWTSTGELYTIELIIGKIDTPEKQGWLEGLNNRIIKLELNNNIWVISSIE